MSNPVSLFVVITLSVETLFVICRRYLYYAHPLTNVCRERYPGGKMGLKHDVYPATRLGIALEEWCRENNESISGMYKEGIRRMAEDPNHPLELDTEVDIDE